MQLIFTALALLTAVHAQSISIGAPLDKTKLSAGQQTVIEIDRPNFLSSAQEVAVAIGIQACADHPCIPPDELLGQLLFSGGFNPQFDPNNRVKPPHQNFTVTIPSNLPKGLAQIGVAHFSLIGAGLEPFLETKNVSVIIQ